MIYLWLALGGALGTVGRYAVSGWVVDRFGPAPLGPFVVNIVGALFIGFVIVLLEGRTLVAPEVRPFIAIGILGGFTTFSTFSYEIMVLVREGSLGAAALNAFGSLLCGLIAVWLGMTLARFV